MNPAVKIGLLVAGGFASYKIAKVVSAAMVAMGMVIDIIPETKVDMQGIRFLTNIDITNPTDSSMTFTSPFVQLLHQGIKLTNNEVSSQQFEIKPLSKTRLPINLQLSWEQIQSLLDTVNIKFPNGYSNLQQMMWMYNNYTQLINKLGLEVNYSTYANGILYKDTEKIKL